MAKLIINSRDEMFIINLDKVVCIQADGNITAINYIEGLRTVVSMGISRLEQLIASAYSAGSVSPFVRVGRSLIINRNYLMQISVQKQKLVLSDYGPNSYALPVSKQLLKSFREMLQNKSITIKTPAEHG